MKWYRLPPLCVQLSTFCEHSTIYIYIYIYTYTFLVFTKVSEVIGKEEKQYLKKIFLHFFIRDFLWGIFQEVIVLFITAVGSRSSLWAHIFSWTVLVEWVVRGKHVFWAFTQIAKTCIWGPFPCDDVGMQEHDKPSLLMTLSWFCRGVLAVLHRPLWRQQLQINVLAVCPLITLSLKTHLWASLSFSTPTKLY